MRRLVPLLLIAGCSPNLKLPAGANVACGADQDCPGTLICNRAGLCVRPSEIDTTPPDLAQAPLVAPRVGRAHVEFSIELAVTEALLEPPSVTLGLVPPLALPCSETEVLRWRCTYTSSGAENEGLGGVVPFDVRLVDRSRNETVKRLAGALKLDFFPPALAVASVAPALAPLGSEVQVFFASSEPLAGAPALRSSVALGGTMLLTPIPQEGTLNWRFVHAVTSADAATEVRFIVSLVDEAGNAATDEVGTVTIDNVPPGLLAWQVTPTHAREGSLVEVLFTADGPLASVEATVDGASMDRDQSVAEPDHRFLRFASPSDGPGPKAVLVEGRDPAGNELFESLGSVVFDFTPPAIIATTVSPASARRGEVIVYNMAASEPLGAAPIPRVAGPGALDFALQPGTQFVFLGPVGDAASDGLYTLTFPLQDLAGNSDMVAGDAKVRVDVTAPEVTDLEVSPERIDETGAVTAQFGLGETPAALAVNIGAWPMTCGAPAGLRYTCTRDMRSDDIPAGSEAQQVVLVRVTDAAGNFGSASATVVFDFRDPDVVSGSVGRQLTPGGSNPLPRVDDVTSGTRVAVSFALDEPTASAPSVTAVSVAQPAETLTFARTGGAGASHVYEHLIAPGAHVQGPYIVQESATDLAGNAATRALTVFTVDTAAPAAPSTAGAVHVRVPWGREATAGVPAFQVRVPAGAFEAGGTLIAFEGTDLTRVAELGRLPTDGSTATTLVVPLVRVDHPAAALAVADRAGNLSPASEVRDVEWTVTLGNKRGGSVVENPTVLAGTSYLLPWLEQAADVLREPAQAELDQLARVDGAGARRSGELRWVERTPTGATPGPRSSHGMIHDPVRGLVLLFAGRTGSQKLNDSWEWNSATGLWVQRLTQGAPEARETFGMAYDSRRGRMVVFGGEAALLRNDLWELDVSTGKWTERIPASSAVPAARDETALVYDSARDRFVLFGGHLGGPSYLRDTWEWDPASGAWTDRTPNPLPGSWPVARHFHAMAYDEGRGKVMMFGGETTGGTDLADVWEWDGSSGAWFSRSGPGPWPSARVRHALVYDRGRSRVVLFGGDAPARQQDLWEWNGAAGSWTDRTPGGAKPPARSWHALGYDPLQRRVVLHGGWVPIAPKDLSDTWEWDGSTGAWVERTASGATPSASWGLAMAHDRARRRTVLFGGTTTTVRSDVTAETWEWDGALGRWLDRTPDTVSEPRPAARVDHALVYDAGRGRTVLFGGLDNTDGPHLDTWEWDGASGTWLDRTPASLPSSWPAARFVPGMAFDALRGVAVLFGGSPAYFATATNYFQDTWEWAGGPGTWTNRTPTGSKPSKRYGPGLAYHEDRLTTVFFAGADTTARSDTWEWDGSSGIWLDRTVAGRTPMRGAQPRIAYDAGRHRISSYGTSLTYEESKLWEWDGAGWVERTPSGIQPAPRGSAGWAYDPDRGRAVLFGGGSTPITYRDTWELDSATDLRPAILWRVPVPTAGTLQGLTLVAYAGGRGHTPAGAPVEGVHLLGWDSRDGAWRELGWGTSPPEAPSAVVYSTSSGAQVDRLLFGADPAVIVAVAPREKNGGASPFGEVLVDYLELTVRYRRPEGP